MSILTRLNTLARANLNDLTDRVNDPKAKVTLLLHEMQSHLAGAKREIRELLVLEKRLERELEKLRKKEKTWEDRATKAVKLEDDGLARQCLYQRFEVEKAAKDLSSQIEEGRGHVRRLLSASKKLEARVKSLRLKENTLKIQAGKGSTSDAFSEFERIEHSVEGQLAESDLDAEMDPGAKALEEEMLKQRLSNLENSSKADEELAKLKKQVSTLSQDSTGALSARKPSSLQKETSGNKIESENLQKELNAIEQQLTKEWKLEDSLEDLKRQLDKEDSQGSEDNGVL